MSENDSVLNFHRNGIKPSSFNTGIILSFFLSFLVKLRGLWQTIETLVEGHLDHWWSCRMYLRKGRRALEIVNGLKYSVSSRLFQAEPVCCHVKVVGLDQSYRILFFSNPKPLRGYNLTPHRLTLANLTDQNLSACFLTPAGGCLRNACIPLLASKKALCLRMSCYHSSSSGKV